MKLNKEKVKLNAGKVKLKLGQVKLDRRVKLNELIMIITQKVRTHEDDLLKIKQEITKKQTKNKNQNPQITYDTLTLKRAKKKKKKSLLPLTTIHNFSNFMFQCV